MAFGLVALAVMTVSVAAVLVAISYTAREVPETRRALGAFRGPVEPALARVRTATDEARARLAEREAQQ